uniref:Uncharacterized protein n=1 Tax=Theileria annulata TaxID=5874 RepID=A0A3B0NFE6_THEAN
MIKNYLDIDDILFNSDIQDINNKINKHKKASSASLEEEVTKFINDTCKILEKLLNKELSSNECLIVIKNNFNKIIKCSRQSTVTNHILNNVFNLLYEKFILIIIYICKSNADQQIIQATSNLIYNAISHIYHHLFSLNNKNEASQNNQNRLLIHIWDILLLLIYSKDKRLRTNTCQFLHHFVYNCCIDEIVINSDLYHKHIKHILNLFLTNVSSTSGVGPSGSSGSKDKINLCIILVKLLQSFQASLV